MGGPMADHVFLAGFPLAVWSRTPAKLKRFNDEGVAIAQSLEILGAASDIVCLCVNRTQDVMECLEELTRLARPDTLFVDHSTILPSAARQIHADLRARGFRFVDAPVTGGSMGAQKGHLTIFCGGESIDIEDARPVMNCYSKRAERVGGPGAGQMMKAANQIAVCGSLIGLCEALSFADKAGLDLVQTRELVGSGAAASWAFENYGPKILERDWSPGFTVDNQEKDLQYCERAAQELGAAIPAARLVHRLLKEMQQDGDGGLTTAALFEKLSKMGGEA